jgi:hypothetical protein
MKYVALRVQTAELRTDEFRLTSGDAGTGPQGTRRAITRSIVNKEVYDG